MNRICFSFLLGSLIPAVSLYLTGGSTRFYFLFGFTLSLLLILLPILLNIRKTALLLWSLDYALRSFRSRFHQGMKEAPSELGRRAEDKKPVNPFAGDVVSALCNLGGKKAMPAKQAERIVEQMSSSKIYTSFEEMFKEAVQIVTKVGA